MDTRCACIAARPRRPLPTAPLVLYASGDGGWFGAAVDMWRLIAAAGYPVVGCSRAFPRTSGLIEPRSTWLGWPPEHGDLIAAPGGRRRRVVAPGRAGGWSRGASLQRAGRRTSALAGDLQGAVAIGLAEGEDLQVDDSDDDSDDGAPAAGAGRWPFDNYAHLAALHVPRGDPGHRRRLLPRGVCPPAARPRHGDPPALRHRGAEPSLLGRGHVFVAALTDALAWEAGRQASP
ncbi:MAG: hypothetical protein R2708_24015 [Vicinamibacterales bacterium]